MVKSKEEFLNEILSLIDSFPQLPDNIIKLKRICANPNTNFTDIVPIIEKDAGMCADILHMANSAYFAVSHEVESIKEAVRYIGFDAISDFVTIAFSNRIINGEFKNIKNLDKYFKHSEEVATATKYLAKSANKSPELIEFFTIAGLLHDIGRLIILVVSDTKMRNFLGNTWDHKSDTATIEKIIFGINHCEIGQMICEKWNFSYQLQKAVLNHHAPLKGEYSEEAAFILLAHFFTMKDFPTEEIVRIYSNDLLDRLNLSREKIYMARALYNEQN